MIELCKGSFVAWGDLGLVCALRDEGDFAQVLGRTPVTEVHGGTAMKRGLWGLAAVALVWVAGVVSVAGQARGVPGNVAFNSARDGNNEIYVMTWDGRQPLHITTDHGRFLAYESTESGVREVYVRPFPDTQSARWQISRGGGNSVVWSRDGKELFYLAESDVMMASRTTYAEGTFNVEAPRKLFDASFARAGEYLTFDVAADGRFLMAKPDIGPAASVSSTLIVKTRVFDVFR